MSKTKQESMSQGRIHFGSRETTALGEDVVGLLLHQHGHVLHITAPRVQTLLHPFDLKQDM